MAIPGVNNRTFDYQLDIDWNFDGAYTAEQSRLISARGEMRLVPPEDGITVGRSIISSMALTLRNNDGRYSALRPDGALYAYIANGGAYHAPCQFRVSIDGSRYHPIFTGIVKLPREAALTSRSSPTITLDARSNEERILQRRTSTTMTQFSTWHTDGSNEADIIQDVLVDALGLTLPGDAALISIDPGIFSIPYAWLDDESAVEALWSIASATGGRYYTDPEGVHCYENFAHWQSDTRSTAVQYTYTKDNYSRLDAWYEDKDLASEVKVQASTLREAYQAVAWEIDAPLLIHPGATEKVTAELDDPMIELTSITWIARTLGGTDATSSITVTPDAPGEAGLYAQRVTFTIANSGSFMVAVAKLTITGKSIVAEPVQTVTRTAVDDGTNGSFFTNRSLTRTKRITAKRYIQSLVHAQSLAQYLLERSERPRLMFRMSGCPGNPDLWLGDRIRIVDNDWQ